MSHTFVIFIWGDLRCPSSAWSNSKKMGMACRRGPRRQQQEDLERRRGRHGQRWGQGRRKGLNGAEDTRDVTLRDNHGCFRRCGSPSGSGRRRDRCCNGQLLWPPCPLPIIPISLPPLPSPSPARRQFSHLIHQGLCGTRSLYQ